jgi:hypothetical protein
MVFHTYIQTDRQVVFHTYRQTDRQTFSVFKACGVPYIQTDRPTDRQTVPNAQGSSWMLLACFGCFCLVLLAAHGCSKLFQVAHGCSWLLRAAPGCSCLLPIAPAAPNCCQLLPSCCRLAPGCSWQIPTAPGNSWLLLAAPGRSWLPLASS